jgi:1-acyl-sn-glycerol-3-phosphate acyltransferase
VADSHQPPSPPTGDTTELVAIRATDRPPEAAVAAADQGEQGLPGLEPDRGVTDWGRSERLTGLIDATLVSFLYHYWFRVEAEGVENVPRQGGALLVANRAGQMPVDGAMIARALREEHPRDRPVHLALTRSFAHLPLLGMAVTKLGSVAAHPANLHRLLFDEGQLVVVFPEGPRASGKPLRARYRLRRFDGLEFVGAALRARVPIVPVAVLGAEEASPTVASLPGLGRRLRLPLGTPVPFPAKFRLRFLQPIHTDTLELDSWRDAVRAQELGEEVRTLLQENLFDMVAQRRSVWLG